MIQIRSTILRNLDKICDEHYNSLQAVVTAKLASLAVRQRNFISLNLKRILTSKPDELARVNEEYKLHCRTAPGRKMKNIYKGLNSAFDYRRFSKKEATYYCGYDLAQKLNMKTCPYCNRNYTVSIANGRARVVRPDFDHFFPKKQYPLLALSFYNLIPSCPVCNRTIKNQATIVYGRYIHPYEEGYSDALKINFFPNDVDSSIGIRTNYQILTISNPIQPIKATKCQESFKLFKLKEIYEESHNGEIADIIRKHYISSGKYLEELQKAFPAIGSIDELYRLAFGNYYFEDDFEKRPLSKLTKDVVDQLIFSYPGVTK